jgi:hypothetical protein
MERALIRLKLGAPWLDNGALVRLNSEVSPSSAPACAGARWTAGCAALPVAAQVPGVVIAIISGRLPQ